eukprot:2717483-Prymnesium_polylepis.1
MLSSARACDRSPRSPSRTLREMSVLLDHEGVVVPTPERLLAIAEGAWAAAAGDADAAAAALEEAACVADMETSILHGSDPLPERPDDLTVLRAATALAAAAPERCFVELAPRRRESGLGGGRAEGGGGAGDDGDG